MDKTEWHASVQASARTLAAELCRKDKEKKIDSVEQVEELILPHLKNLRLLAINHFGPECSDEDVSRTMGLFYRYVILNQTETLGIISKIAKQSFNPGHPEGSIFKL